MIRIFIYGYTAN